jgi:glycosyltransferase involved in cell wall biosynthesis
LRVVFYGQFIPLHGIGTIVEAARNSDAARVQWVIIGSGQESARIQAMLDEKPVPNLQWIPWVEYEDLRAQIASADVCLGIFGDSDKAGRVIPNKVFQILSVGAPLITRDSPGIRELLDDDDDGVAFVPPADPAALLQAVYAQPRRAARVLHRKVVERFSRKTLAQAVTDVVVKARQRKQRS